MSAASSVRQPTSSADVTGRHQRSAKNYLLDRRFQLKYTGYLVGVAAFLSIALGLLLWSTSAKLIEQSQRAVEQGQEMVVQGQTTVDRGKQLIVQSRKVSQVVAMNIAKEYKDDPELAKVFQEEAAKDERRLVDEQERLERDAVALSRRADDLLRQANEIATQQQRILVGLVVLLVLLVIAIGFAGIVVTHRIAGPIFKMKRLLRQVGEGKLVVRERLRKGDELVHFFGAFERMVDDLRARQLDEIEKVDRILTRLEESIRSERGADEVDDDGVALLKRLRREMQDHIEA
jgi:nitrogen fixation/metabolism regulation signal transduction histidine kinase